MGILSARSLKSLEQAHPLHKKLWIEVAKKTDILILDAQRGRAAQELAFKQGNTKVHFGNSAHNYVPALALDVVPLPLDWNNYKAFIKLAQEIVLPLAKGMGIPIRWGGDWNMNGQWNDENFRDLPHYELTPWRDVAKRDCKLMDD